MTTALEGGEGSASSPGSSLPPGKTRYPLYRRLGGTQDRSGQVRKNSPPLGFDSRTVQPLAIRYSDWATRPTQLRLEIIIFCFQKKNQLYALVYVFDSREIVVCFLICPRELPHLQISNRLSPTQWSPNYFLRGKLAVVWSWLLSSTQCRISVWVTL